MKTFFYSTILLGLHFFFQRSPRYLALWFWCWPRWVRAKCAYIYFQTLSLRLYSSLRERVVVEISLYSCTKFSNDWFVPVFLRGAVILIYCLRWATTQSSISLSVFSFVVLFLTTSEIFMESKLKHLIAWSLGAVVKHKNIANLCENVFRSQSVRVGFELIKVNILVKSWVVTYLGKTGLIF